jgi:hypothetical protein
MEHKDARAEDNTLQVHGQVRQVHQEHPEACPVHPESLLQSKSHIIPIIAWERAMSAKQ